MENEIIKMAVEDCKETIVNEIKKAILAEGTIEFLDYKMPCGEVVREIFIGRNEVVMARCTLNHRGKNSEEYYILADCFSVGELAEIAENIF